MLKITQGVSVITLTLGNVSSEVVHLLEHSDHTVSLLNGESAVDILTDLHEKLSAVVDYNNGTLDMTDKIIARLKSALALQPGPYTAPLQSLIEVGRSKQEKARAENDIINEILKDVDRLIPWAKKFGQVEEPVKPVVELEAPKASEEVKVPQSKQIKDLLQDVLGNGCCGECQDEVEDLMELANATSDRSKTVSNFLNALLGDQGGRLPESFMAGLKQGLTERLNENRSERQEDPLAAMFRAGRTANRNPAEENHFAKLFDLPVSYKDQAPKSGDPKGFEGLTEMIADKLGVNPNQIRIIPMPMPQQ